MGRWLETYQTPEEILMGKIKTISMNIIAKYKSEIPDFDMDLDTFVKELATDVPQITRLFELLIKDTFKRNKRISRSPSQVPSQGTPAPGSGEARLTRVIQQHQQQRLATHGAEQDQSRDIAVDGTRYRIVRPRSPMDVDGNPDGPASGSRRVGLYHVEDVRSTSLPGREEDKEDDGPIETTETGIGAVVG